jgi:hypothetical protein
MGQINDKYVSQHYISWKIPDKFVFYNSLCNNIIDENGIPTPTIWERGVYQIPAYTEQS